ncbi:discoidin domain-containing protein, partial [Streptomyces sp. GbtcB7]|uniref:discoidin domain-containing protein n=1 Tax=Streptomyces sp. GbtcB7 TaxID=2824752 RepID=UPI0027E4DEAA
MILALHQTATASSYTQNYVPSNAVDGCTTTYWESANNALPQWFKMDLGPP